jgi:transposase InsO family protein
VGGNLTRESITEYAAAVRPRYAKARRSERGRILDEFCATTGYHRKAAIRLLNRRGRPLVERRGRPAVYAPEVGEALARVWEASGRLCSKRLVPFLPSLLEALERHGEMGLTAAVRARLLALSPATIDRLLKARRSGPARRPYTSRSAPAALRAQVPVRTFGEWAGVAPGAAQADLVAHCGESGEGFFLTSLCVVDVATSWTELQEVFGRGQDQVRGALHRARQRFPFPLTELHTDNGSEFLNRSLVPYCQRNGLKLTRGRPYRKNDQAYVEERNGSVIRGLIGYDRYASRAAHAELASLYRLVRLWVNYFQPVRKLVAKERAGARVVKRFDQARTPFQRILAAGVASEETRAALEQEYRRLNPVALRRQVERGLERLWALAETTGAAARGAAAGGSEGASRP